MIRYFLFISVLLTPLYSYAEVTWTGGVGAGVMIVDGIKPSHLEKQVSTFPGVASNSNIKDKTTYKSFSLGRCWNENFCVEGSYLWGAEFNTSLTINNVNVGVVNIQGTPIDLGSLPVNLILRREAEVSATQLSALWKVPVSDFVDVFGRAGFYNYNVKVTAKILLPNTSIFLAEQTEERGLAGVASIGVDMKLFKKVAIRMEGQKTGTISIFSVMGVYVIK